MFLWLHRKKLFTIFITVTEVAIVIVTYILFVKIYGIYSGILPQRHQDTKTIESFFVIAFLMRGTLKFISLRLINEKTPLFNLYSFSLCVFVPLAQTWQAMLRAILYDINRYCISCNIC